MPTKGIHSAHGESRPSRTPALMTSGQALMMLEWRRKEARKQVADVKNCYDLFIQSFLHGVVIILTIWNFNGVSAGPPAAACSHDCRYRLWNGSSFQNPNFVGNAMMTKKCHMKIVIENFKYLYMQQQFRCQMGWLIQDFKFWKIIGDWRGDNDVMRT